MRCFTDRRRSLLLCWMAGVVAFALAPAEVCHAAPGTGAGAVTSPDRLDDLLRVIPEGKAGGFTPDEWAQIARRMGDPDVRGRALEALRKVEPFPSRLWVNLLNHEELAVRLGALEVLEEFTGSDLDYDPWEQDVVLRTAAWQPWVRWADSGARELPGKQAATGALPAEAMQAYLRDLMAGEAGRTERALGKLKPHARQAIGSIELFLTSQPSLMEGMRSRLKEAQYRLLLELAGFRDSRRAGRLLALGTRDERVEGLDMLAKAPKLVLPLVTEALRDREGLVRERAMDVLLGIGGASVLPLAEEHLKTETETAVIHAAIRAMGRLGSTSGLRLLVPYLKVNDEDQVTSALLSLSLVGEGARSAKAEIKECLKHASWRVRAGALQCITKARVTGLDNEIIALLDDADSFVRTAAVQALAAGAGGGGRSFALPGSGEKSGGQIQKALIQAFHKHDDLKAPVCKAFAAMSTPVPEELMKALPATAPEVQVTALAVYSQHVSPRERGLFEQAAESKDLDLACIALRGLAHASLRDSSIEKRLAEALMGSSPEKRDAVLDGLSWPRRRALRGEEWTAALQALDGQTAAAAPAPVPAKADVSQSLAGQILQAFGSPPPDTRPPATTPAPSPAAKADSLAAQVMAAFGAAPAPVSAPASPAAAQTVAEGPVTTVIQALQRLATAAPLAGDGPASNLARDALKHLMQSGSPHAAALLEPALEKLDVQDRAELPEALVNAPQPAWLPLWRRLLHDPSREVRQRAFTAAIEEEDRTVLIKFALGELLRPGEHLRPADVCSSQLIAIAADDNHKWMAAEAARKMCETDRPADLQVLGLILLRSAGEAKDLAVLESRLQSPSYWVRRAAAMALGKLGPEVLKKHLPELVKDESAWVREAAAAGLSKSLKVWQHHFDDTTQIADDSHENSFESLRGSGFFGKTFTPAGQKTGQDTAAEQALRTLTQDREDNVRLAAWMALLVQRAEVDVAEMNRLLDRAPDPKAWAERLADHIETNYQTLGPALRPLLERIEWTSVRADKVGSIERHFGLSSTGPAVTTFAALAQAAPAGTPAPAKPPAQYLAPGQQLPAAGAQQTELPVTAIFFHNPGCQECEKVRNSLTRLQRQHPGLTVKEYNIRDTEAVLLNETLSSRFAVPPQSRLTTPAVFFQEGVLLKDNLSFRALQQMYDKTADVGDGGTWQQTAQGDLTEAKNVVEKRYQEGVTLAAVVGAGLLDGINPCAFATMIFFLSYLQVSRRTPGEILAVGSAFIAAVFVTYFVLGLGLVEVVARIESLRIAGRVLTWVLAISCLYIARLSFRDAKLADQGRLKDMSLQLPAFLKEHIRGVIRTGARSRRFVFAAAGAGVVISVLELACTGQVYVPTIVYALKTGSMSAAAFLLIYNIAFITPLLLLFLLAWRGMKSDALVQFQQRHTGKVKRALGWLFLILFVLLLFSGRL